MVELDIKLIGSIGIIALGFWGAWQQFAQANVIRQKQSCESISTEGMLIQLFMGYTSMIYGATIVSIPMVIHGTLRSIALYSIINNIKNYRPFTKKQIYFRRILRAALPLLIIAWPLRGYLYLTYSLFGVLGSIKQFHELLVAKTTGALDVRLQLVYLVSATFWLIYGYFGIHDRFVTIMSCCFIVILVATIALWFGYFFQEKFIKAQIPS